MSLQCVFDGRPVAYVGSGEAQTLCALTPEDVLRGIPTLAMLTLCNNACFPRMAVGERAWWGDNRRQPMNLQDGDVVHITHPSATWGGYCGQCHCELEAQKRGVAYLHPFDDDVANTDEAYFCWLQRVPKHFRHVRLCQSCVCDKSMQITTWHAGVDDLWINMEVRRDKPWWTPTDAHNFIGALHGIEQRGFSASDTLDLMLPLLVDAIANVVPLYYWRDGPAIDVGSEEDAHLGDDNGGSQPSQNKVCLSKPWALRHLSRKTEVAYQRGDAAMVDKLSRVEVLRVTSAVAETEEPPMAWVTALTSLEIEGRGWNQRWLDFFASCTNVVSFEHNDPGASVFPILQRLPNLRSVTLRKLYASELDGVSLMLPHVEYLTYELMYVPGRMLFCNDIPKMSSLESVRFLTCCVRIEDLEYLDAKANARCRILVGDKSTIVTPHRYPKTIRSSRLHISTDTQYEVDRPEASFASLALFD